ncbi:hypothetical protein [Hydrotalea lipotrueae]|uniref:hypothetical protein n=1 Tax=Hydrotalea lipotrueae TaxID=2803817 RepID=UPI001C493379|nr:hypothetical protein [Hydrotalea lipotrueae]
MKQLLIILLVAFVSCTNQQTAEQHEYNTGNDKLEKVVTVPLNNSAKWKADEATKKNVAAMVQVVRDSTYADAGKRIQLYTNLKTKIDTLVKECSMKGAEHDALHVWLEKVLKDLKELKEDDDEYGEAYAALKKDIANFYQSFE